MSDNIEEVVYDFLTTDSTFMANFEGVYEQEAETETATTPYIVFWLVDDSGAETKLNSCAQGEARIQFDLWDDNRNRGRRLRTVLRNKVNSLNGTSGGYNTITDAITEQTILRASKTDPFHYVVDGVIKWSKE